MEAEVEALPPPPPEVPTGASGTDLDSIDNNINGLEEEELEFD
jgi:hypothetical protein